MTADTSTMTIAVRTSLQAAFAGVLFGVLRGISTSLDRGVLQGFGFVVLFGLLVFCRKVRHRNRARCEAESPT